MTPELEKLLKRALVGLKMGADLAYATETTDSQSAMAGAVCVKIETIEEEMKAFLLQHNADVDLPDTAAQDSASKSNNPAVSG